MNQSSNTAVQSVYLPPTTPSVSVQRELPAPPPIKAVVITLDAPQASELRRLIGRSPASPIGPLQSLFEQLLSAGL